MDTRLITRVLWTRRQLLRRDHWTRAQLEAHQARSLQELRAHAYSSSSFYQRFHHRLTAKPLHELPVLTKQMLMDSFDRLVTDPHVRLHELEAFLAQADGSERFLGRYFVNATSGSTGKRGIFVFDRREWSAILASYARSYAWAGVTPGLTTSVKTAVVSTTTSWHQSAMVGTSVKSPFVPTLRLNATEPLEHLVAELNKFQPEALIGYPSVVRLLAEAQLGGQLKISPRAVLTAAEVLTEETKRRIHESWGRVPFNVYGATETATLASECEHHRLHLFEDLVITEVVDENNRPVPAGEYGAKVLVTVLFSRTLPLIRYEMSDSIRLGAGSCPCGRPYALVQDIQGRREEVLELPGAKGDTVKVHPNVFHDALDLLPVGGWQVVEEPEGLLLLLVEGRDRVSEAAVTDGLRNALIAQGVAPPPVTVRWVGEIPKSIVGKTPLIKAKPSA